MLLGLVGCVEPQSEFRCEQPCECRRGDERGTCEPTGFCSFDDTECRSGRRYAVGASAELAGECVQGTAWYVAPEVTTAELGTFAQPFGTLQQAVDVAVPGDTIIVEDGTYGPGSADSTQFPVAIDKAATADAPILLRAQHAHGAILDCGGQCAAYIQIRASAAYWTIDGFEIVRGYWGGIYSIQGGSHITISHNHIHDIGLRVETDPFPMVGIVANELTTDYVIDGNVIEHIGRPNDAGNSFDPLLLMLGKRMTITNNVLTQALSGWHIETAASFSGTIANNTFVGPNMWMDREGQLMLASGIGDITIRMKQAIKRSPRSGFALGLDLRLPSGDEKNLLGTGAPAVQPFVAWSATYGALAPHINVGYQWNGSSILAGDIDAGVSEDLPDVAVYAVGAVVAVHPRVTLALDVLGRYIIDSPRVRLSDFHALDGRSVFPNITFDTGSINELSSAAGLKINIAGRLLLNTNLLMRLNSAGLRDKISPLVGIEYAF